jgi:hypothetical protein
MAGFGYGGRVISTYYLNVGPSGSPIGNSVRSSVRYLLAGRGTKVDGGLFYAVGIEAISELAPYSLATLLSGRKRPWEQ